MVSDTAQWWVDLHVAPARGDGVLARGRLAFGVSQPAGATGTTRYVSTSAVGVTPAVRAPVTRRFSPRDGRFVRRHDCGVRGDVRRRCGQCEGSNLPGANIGVAGATQSGPESIVSSIGVTNANVPLTGLR